MVKAAVICTRQARKKGQDVCHSPRYLSDWHALQPSSSRRDMSRIWDGLVLRVEIQQNHVCQLKTDAATNVIVVGGSHKGGKLLLYLCRDTAFSVHMHRACSAHSSGR